MAKEITVPAIIASVDTLTAFAEEEMELHDCPMKAVMQVDVAIDELFSNIANYAYPDEQGQAKIEIDFLEEPRAVKLTFTDWGIPYNPLEKEDPDVTLSAEEREIGGLGIYLVKKSMDQVTYKYEDSCNVVSIYKNY